MKLTKKETIYYHRKMWNWLADNPEREKDDWPGWNHLDDSCCNDCFLCEYVYQNHDSICLFCPLEWEITRMCNNPDEKDSYFYLYHDSNDNRERSKYARKIANLKEKIFL